MEDLEARRAFGCRVAVAPGGRCASLRRRASRAAPRPRARGGRRTRRGRARRGRSSMPGRRDEMVEERRRRRLARRARACRAPRPGGSGRSAGRRPARSSVSSGAAAREPALDLLLPQPRHDELQVRRLDLVACRGRFRRRALPAPERSSTTWPVFDLRRGRRRRAPARTVTRSIGARQRVVALDRPLDRLARRGRVQMADPQRTLSNSFGICGLEAIELGERVLADRDDEARLQARHG